MSSRISFGVAFTASLAFACSSDPATSPSPDLDAGTHDPVDGSTANPTPEAGAVDHAITVPATISGAAGQQSITDPAFFSGFAGAHAFGRGAKGPSLLDAPSSITDCRLTIDASTLTLEGGGETITAPLISTNPNAKTNIVAEPDNLKLGGIELMNFFDASGSAINVGVTYGVVTAVGGTKTGVAIQCGTSWASSVTADRSQDTLTIADATLASLIGAAGGGSSFNKPNAAAADLGGASGSVVLGRGVRRQAASTNAQLIDDCKVEVTAGTIRVSGGGVSASDTFSGAANDVITIVQTPVEKKVTFRPESAINVSFTVNAFGFVTQVSAKAEDGTLLSCP